MLVVVVSAIKGKLDIFAFLGVQRYANTYLTGRQDVRTVLIGQFLGPIPSKDDINEFKPLNLMSVIICEETFNVFEPNHI